MSSSSLITRITFAASALAVAACASTSYHRATSVVDYLYSSKQVVVEPSIPTLSLPIKIGIAFVPGSADVPGGGIPESDRQRLLSQVADHFRRQAYVKKIEVIPSTYLIPRGGFENLEGISRMFDVDVVALVSYDQAQFSSSHEASLIYWTLIGAYLVQGEKNDTRTLLDAAVFDIRSRRLLFRAPGVSTVKGSATLVAVDDALRKDAARGFQVAATNLLVNLDTELETFQAKVREARSDVKVVETQEYKDRKAAGGAGATDTIVLFAASLLGLAASLRRVARFGS